MAECSHATLIKLPNELLTTVTEHLDRQDLINLRLTCRKIASAVDHAFIIRFFTKRTHLFTQYGLQALLDMASVPRLAKEIKEMQIVVQDLDCDFSRQFGGWLYSYTDAGAKYKAQTKAESNEEQGLDRQWKERHQAERRVLLTWQAMKDERTNERDVELLCRAFTGFATVNKRITVCVTDTRQGQQCWSDGEDNGFVGTYGIRQLRKSLGSTLKLRDLDHAGCKRAVRIVLSALADSGIDVEELNSCDGNTEYGVTAPMFEVGDARFARLLRCFEKAATLRLGFSREQNEVWSAGPDAYCQHLMAAALNLRTISVSWINRWEIDSASHSVFNWLTQTLQSPQLHNVRLQTIGVPDKQLMVFFKKHRETLESLELRSVVAPLDGSWHSILQCIVKDLHLQSVELDHLRRSDYIDGDILAERRFNVEGVAEYTTSFHLYGREHVNSEIARLCHSENLLYRKEE